MKAQSLKSQALKVDPKRPRALRHTVAAAARPASWQAQWWVYALGALAAYICLYWAYGPALRGEFVFDDLHLHVSTQPAAILYPIREWLHTSALLPCFLTGQTFISSASARTHTIVWNLFFHTGAAVLSLLHRAQDSRSGRHRRNRQPTSIFSPSSPRSCVSPAPGSDGRCRLCSRPRGRPQRSACFSPPGAYFSTGAMPSSPGCARRPSFSCSGPRPPRRSTPSHFPAVLLLTDYYFNPGLFLEGCASGTGGSTCPSRSAVSQAQSIILGYIRRDTH